VTDAQGRVVYMKKSTGSVSSVGDVFLTLPGQHGGGGGGAGGSQEDFNRTGDRKVETIIRVFHFIFSIGNQLII